MASKLSQSGRQEVTSSHQNQFKPFQWINGNMHCKPFWKSPSPEEIPRHLLWMPSNYYQNRLVCPTHSKPNAETWRFVAEKEFIQKAAKCGDGRTASDLPPQRQGAWDIYGIKKQGGLRLGVTWLVGRGTFSTVVFVTVSAWTTNLGWRGGWKNTHLAPCTYVRWYPPARILEWIATFFSRGFTRPRNRTCVSWVSLQVDSLPLSHQGSPSCPLLTGNVCQSHTSQGARCPTL